MAYDTIREELWDGALSELSPSVAEAIRQDPFAETLYETALWDWNLAGDTRNDAYEAFAAYMDEYYDVEWEEIFDWDAWREAYDSQ